MFRPCGEGKAAAFNRRMRKTARPVVWEGDGAQSPSLDPIQKAWPHKTYFFTYFFTSFGPTSAP